jgi:photosystem II stability/assembly factor-like uncharacterized protein
VPGRPSGENIERIGAVGCIVLIPPLVYIASEGGLFVSRDFGETWSKLQFAGGATTLLTTRWPHADPTLLVGTPAGLVVSPDGGYRFRTTAVQSAVSDLEWPGPELVVATASGASVSRDTGASWTPPGRDLPPAAVRTVAVSSYFALDPVIFAGLEGNGVWRSGDAGASWSPTGLTAPTVNDLQWIGMQLLAATDAGVFQSLDAGRTWSPPATGLDGRTARRLLFPLAPDSTAEGFLATDAGVYRTADGGKSWRPSGLSEEHVLTLATFPPPERTPGKKKR